MPNIQTEAKDASIQELTTAIDSQGMQSYFESLKLHLLTEVVEDLEDTAEIENAINTGWQGVARDNFLTNLSKQITSIEEDLEKEYNNVEARMGELQSDYFNQDQNMVQIEE